MMRRVAAFILILLSAPINAGVPSVPGADAPELAALGAYGVGFRSVTFTHRNQPDIENASLDASTVRFIDRSVQVDIWYPATVRKGAQPVLYRGSLWAEPPLPPVAFTQKGMAVAGAKVAGSQHPLVIISHGYSNNPAVMTWLTENLASKGYVVAAIHHRDPNPYVVSSSTRAAPNFNRPHDIVFAAAQLRATLGDLIDPDNVALIGYSQGGYGVLTAGGATLDPVGPNMNLVAGGWLKKFARGTVDADAIKLTGVKAVVALAPGGGAPSSAWGPEGLAALTAPLLLIQGDSDPVVDYKTGALAVFGGAVHADRYLLTYRQAGHAIALNPAPREMRGSVWDMDWFEDPIWRQDRINAINLHFITAFLAVYLRNDASESSYLNVQVENSDDGEWNAPAGTPWGAFSTGDEGVTLWKGFQRRHARGMTLRHLPKAPN
ncbi:MAG: alpha/beta hydrolase family protein [Sphingorhabdus sp.]